MDDLAVSRFGGVLILIGRFHVQMILESASSGRPELGRVFNLTRLTRVPGYGLFPDFREK
jgi:hypothetical protein